jgi:hypothetical protein
MLTEYCIIQENCREILSKSDSVIVGKCGLFISFYQKFLNKLIFGIN